MKLNWTDRSRRDLLAIGRYIARDNPKAARAWVERLRVKVRSAAKMPLKGRIVPERENERVREVFLRNYRIVYEVQKDSILVLTVFQGHRLFQGDVERATED